MNCNICYQDFPKFKLIHAGCCSLQLCESCIQLCKKCPQCKKKYFWVKNDEDETNFKIFKLEQEIMNLKYSLNLSEEETKKLSKKILEQGKEIIKLKILINSEIDNMIDYTNSFDNVIAKYNLNLTNNPAR